MTPDILPQCVETLRLAEKATKGPWAQRQTCHQHSATTYWVETSHTGLQTAYCGGGEYHQNNAKLIAHARTFAPAAAQWIIDAVEREKKKDASLKVAIEALQNIQGQDGYWGELAESAIKEITEALK
jgi:hypothetical protein